MAKHNRARTAAALVAIIAWAGLIIQFDASLKQAGPVLETLWIMLRYFTVIANLFVACAFTVLALGRLDLVSPSRLGAVTVTIMLVGVVYALLLRGMLELSGGARLADFITHTVVPVIVPLYWLFLAPKGGLTPRDPLLWAVLPLAYFAYALTRGAAEGAYAYPFMNVEKLGWGQTMLTALLMAAGFIVAGFAILWIDRRFAMR